MEKTTVTDSIMNVELAVVNKDVGNRCSKKSGTTRDREDMLRLGREQEMNVCQ
jgi:hypothetical protein